MTKGMSLFSSLMWRMAIPMAIPTRVTCPRIDAETGHGLVTDVCLKRKIRNYIELVKEDAEGYEIYVKGRSCPQRTAPQGL